MATEFLFLFNDIRSSAAVPDSLWYKISWELFIYHLSMVPFTVYYEKYHDFNTAEETPWNIHRINDIFKQNAKEQAERSFIVGRCVFFGAPKKLRYISRGHQTLLRTCTTTKHIFQPWVNFKLPFVNSVKAIIHPLICCLLSESWVY